MKRLAFLLFLIALVSLANQCTPDESMEEEMRIINPSRFGSGEEASDGIDNAKDE